MTFNPIEFIGICQIPGTNVGCPGWQGPDPTLTFTLTLNRLIPTLSRHNTFTTL